MQATTSIRASSITSGHAFHHPTTTTSIRAGIRRFDSQHAGLSLPVNRLLPLPTVRTLTLTPSVTITTNPIETTTSTTTTTPTTVDSPSTAYWDYQFLFLSQRAESHTPLPLQLTIGSIPSDFPRGTYYLTGPGLFTDDHGSTVHPLDGHGYLRAFEFGADGEVRYSARYVETEAQREETGDGEWRFTHRGPFSVLKGGKKVGNVKVMKNVANTSVVKWGGRLMCLWEGGEPYEVDGGTLETVGTVDLIGREEDRTVEKKGGGGGGGRGLMDIGVDVAAGFVKPILYGEWA